MMKVCYQFMWIFVAAFVTCMLSYVEAAANDVVVTCDSCENKGPTLAGEVGENLSVLYTIIKLRFALLDIYYNGSRNVIRISRRAVEINTKGITDKNRFIIPKKLTRNEKNWSVKITLKKLSMADEKLNFSYVYQDEQTDKYYGTNIVTVKDHPIPTNKTTTTTKTKTKTTTTAKREKVEKKAPLAIIILAIVVVILIFVVVAIVVVCLKRRRRQTEGNGPFSPAMSLQQQPLQRPPLPSPSPSQQQQQQQQQQIYQNFQQKDRLQQPQQQQNHHRQHPPPQPPQQQQQQNHHRQHRPPPPPQQQQQQLQQKKNRSKEEAPYNQAEYAECGPAIVNRCAENGDLYDNAFERD